MSSVCRVNQKNYFEQNTIAIYVNYKNFNGGISYDLILKKVIQIYYL